MNLEKATKKEIGDYGERAVVRELERNGYRLVGRNIARKTGEIDVLMRKGDTLHFIEVKALSCEELPDLEAVNDRYDPSANLHEVKVRKVARTAEWIVAEKEWEGDWQVDGALVWLRLRDGVAKVLHLPQIV